MAKSSDFKTEDFVVYPTHGVGKVLGTEKQEIAGTELDLLVIDFEHDRMTLRIPLSKAQESGLRPLSSKKQMDLALVKLKGRARVRLGQCGRGGLRNMRLKSIRETLCL